MRLTLKDIFDIPTAEIFEPDKFTPVTSVVIDSRKAKKNSLFVAIEGERFDGHDFAEEAVKNGASAIVINRRKLRRYDKLKVPIVCVKNTTKAYGAIANIWRRKLNAVVVSITGSNGKTTTKDYLAELLKEKYSVVATSANNNNHIGVPLTILSANDRCEVLILEHGTNHFGEIDYTARLAEPDIALITNIGDSHLEYLIDREGVLKEKAGLFDAALEKHGTIIINNDDEYLRKYTRKLNGRKVTFGFYGKPDFKGKVERYDELGRAVVSIAGKNMKLNFTLPTLGKTGVNNVLAAAAAAKTIGATKKEILNGIKKLKAPKGRLNATEKKNFLIIDDTYNSNPNSVKAAVETLKRIKKYKKKILILGDMFELGKNAGEIHESLAEDLAKLRNAEALTIGKNMKRLSAKLKGSMEAKHFNRRETLKKYLKEKEFDGYAALVKGSRGMKMEEFVNVLGEKE